MCFKSRGIVLRTGPDLTGPAFTYPLQLNGSCGSLDEGTCRRTIGSYCWKFKGLNQWTLLSPLKNSGRMFGLPGRRGKPNVRERSSKNLVHLSIVLSESVRLDNWIEKESWSDVGHALAHTWPDHGLPGVPESIGVDFSVREPVAV